MAKTAFATGNALTKKLWEKKLFEDAVKESYFLPRFGGVDSTTSIVMIKNDLTKSKGDNITYAIRMRLDGAGVTSGEALEGNEESLTTHSDSVSLEEYANAVRDRGPLDRQRVAFSIDQTSMDAIKDWGTEKIDQLIFTAIELSPTRFFSRQSGTISKGTSTPAASIEATDTLTPGLISFTKTWCQTGGARTQTPLRMVNVDGKMYYVLLVHPDVLYDLEIDSTFAQARREAEVRSKENPIFTGAYAIWNGVVIHSHENVALSTTFGSGGAVAGSKNSFMGAQAVVWANGMPATVVSKEFDYGREHGFAFKMINGTEKPTFNSKDYGVVAVYTARTNVSG